MGVCLDMSPSAALSGVAEADAGKRGKGGYFVAIAVEIVLLYLVNNLLHNYMANIPDYVKVTYPTWLVNIIDWLARLHVPHLTDKYTSCLWAINTALTVGILGNLVLSLNHSRWLHHLTKGLIFLVAVLPVAIVWRVFPFSLLVVAQANGLRIVFAVIGAALLFGFFIHLFRFIPAWREKIRSDREIRAELQRQRILAAQTATAAVAIPPLPETTPPPEAPDVGQSKGEITNNQHTSSK